MFERTWTVCLLSGDGPKTVPLETKLPGGDPKLTIEAWGSGVLAAILSGRIDLPEASQRISNTGAVDALLTVPPAGFGYRKWAGDGWLTVFFPSANAGPAPQFVTVKIRQTG